ncbi:[Histone H3]-lysine-36 demethylase [Lachancea thermotolerans CBS 6340]|uniref:JmjC domain-containing histone demethylation protein 1 n=1 Tax=Lachancea thermotolerans (strain ATCC 56472 / CBS 6340 / NRRL Y-8284) TaxID=559295 RepID=C5DBM9_LACTC|nr:KLTH0A03960p [Lachancea thermotolerans CBS 6340]CAR21186.1 KLTH0A03960p [Lachancea thermotolerans CBS 6340]
MTKDVCSYCSSDGADGAVWVQCEVCDQWVHVTCIPIKYLTNEMREPLDSYPKLARQIKRFSCSAHGSPVLEVKSTSKKRKIEPTAPAKVGKRQGLRKKKQVDYISLNEGDDKRLKDEHPHMHAFLACFSKWENKTNVIESSRLERDFNAITIPMKVQDPENSGMRIPEYSEGRAFTVDTVTKFLGADYPVDVMDVQSQQNSTWSMSQWNQYFTETAADARDRIRNVISLEVSHVDQFKTGLRRPRVVESHDLVDLLWEEVKDDIPRPKVTKYVLMSVGNAYTDFHLDFAGTSVYYKVIFGSKKFILFPPTPHNLKAYESWCGNDHQNLIFLGDQLEQGVAMELRAGDLFMIPSGFIHAVFTPQDSLVVGGNFLTLRDLATQLVVTEIEKLTKVPKKFTFPQFEAVMGKTAELTLQKSGTDEDLALSIEKEEALLEYIKTPTFKYKPVNFSTKRELISQFQKHIEARSD